MKPLIIFAALLLLTPACLPDSPRPRVRAKNAVLLTTQVDSVLYDSLESEDFRVLVSGFPEETESELLARLPWLLQPGVDVVYYDPRLAGNEIVDSLRTFFNRQGVPFRISLSEATIH